MMFIQKDIIIKPITEHELDVLKMLANGRNNREIVAELFLAGDVQIIF